MNFDYSQLLSVEEIYRPVTVAIDDEEMRLLNVGFYKRMVKEALRKLNYETKFDRRWQDLDVPDNLIVPFPVGGFDIHDIFLYNTPAGSPDSDTTNDADCCSVNGQVRVFWKNNFLTKGRGHGFTARIKQYDSDPFYNCYIDDSQVYFYNVQNGLIMLSDACAAYEKVRIYYAGDAADLDNKKIIPPFCYEGIVSFVTERALFHLKVRDPQKYRTAWMDAKADLPDRWRDCTFYLKRLDSKQRADLSEYLSFLNC